MNTKRKDGSELLDEMFGRPTFGQYIESHRICEEINQKDMAKTLGISPSSLCDLEKGRKIPSISRAIKIARILELEEAVLLEALIQDQLDREKINFKVNLEKVS